MTEELKQAAQAALDQLEFLNACYPHKTATDAADALRRALAQRPAAQEVDGPISASLGDIVALWDQHAPSEYMTAIHMQAKRALAGQQPMSPDMARWCAYVGGMVAHWVKSEPDALARLGDDAFEAAIAGIIERRLWAMPKPAPQQATPEQVGETVARVELMAAGGNAGLATRIAEIDNPLRERLRPGDLLFTQPAGQAGGEVANVKSSAGLIRPGRVDFWVAQAFATPAPEPKAEPVRVPEGFSLDQIADACVQAEISDSKFESLSIALTAAQAKGGAE